MAAMLNVLLSWQAAIIYAFLASALFVHFRGHDRIRFYRQITDHSTFMAPYNALMYLFSAVPNKPFIDADSFPEMKKVTDNWQMIRDEALQLFDEGYIRAAAGYNDLGFNSFFRRGWKRFYVKWYDQPLPSAQALCPKTVALVQSIPSINGAMFAMLPPGGKLGKHRDPFAGSLRYHLGLATPNSAECNIHVDGQPYFWRDGEAVMFDETFIHWAENKTDVRRVILFCDVERPLTSRVMTRDQQVVQEARHQREPDRERHRRQGRLAQSRVQPRLLPARAGQGAEAPLPGAVLRGEMGDPAAAGVVGLRAAAGELTKGNAWAIGST